MSGQTKIIWGEEIPVSKVKASHWVKYKLGDLADITSSKRIFYSDYVTFGVPFYRSKEIIDRYSRRGGSAELFISEEKFLEIKSKFGAPETDDILLTSVGTLGIPYLVKQKDRFYFKDGNLTWFRKINKTIVDVDYLMAWITSSIGKQKLDEISIGSTQAALTIVGLKGVTIDLPAVAEQHAIATVLNSLNDKIDLLHRQNATLEALAQTLFQQWFMEEAQEGWQDGLISDIIDFNPIYRLKKGELAPYLEMSNVSSYAFSPSGWYNREFNSGTKFKNGDTLLARITPCLENGKTAFVTFLEKDEIAWGSTEYIIMRMKPPFHPFLSYVIARNSDFRDFAISSMSGSSGRQRVQTEMLAGYDIKIPDMETIQKMNEQLESILSKLIFNAPQIQTLSTLRDTLLPKLMSGEVRVAY